MNLIHAARSVSFQVEGDVGKASGFEFSNDCLPEHRVEKFFYFLGGYFYPGGFIVIANPIVMNPLMPQKRFASTHLDEALRSDLGTEGESRRETSEGLLVPGWQIEVAA